MTCVLRKFKQYGALENAVSMKYGDMNQNGGCYDYGVANVLD